MQIIPVIDLKNGLVVHAKQGNRDEYAPLKSEICKSSNIFDVINAFSSLFGFSTIYIADLNAITRQSNNADLLADILSAFPHIIFWIDAGYPLCDENLQKHANFLPVLGSESFSEANVCVITNFIGNFILSLDYSATGEMGAKTLFSKQELWPENVIIMSLPRVGSNQGPDFERLLACRKQFPKQNIIAAGGIRDIEDLIKLEQIGIHQALIATALHNGKITPNDVRGSLVQVNLGKDKHCLFVAIDRATRYVYLELHDNRRMGTATAFLQDALAECPFKAVKILTDNGMEFSYDPLPEKEAQRQGTSVCRPVQRQADRTPHHPGQASVD